jgi:hypothetical protein
MARPTDPPNVQRPTQESRSSRPRKTEAARSRTAQRASRLRERPHGLVGGWSFPCLAVANALFGKALAIEMFSIHFLNLVCSSIALANHGSKIADMLRVVT